MGRQDVGILRAESLTGFGLGGLGLALGRLDPLLQSFELEETASAAIARWGSRWPAGSTTSGGPIATPGLTATPRRVCIANNLTGAGPHCPIRRNRKTDRHEGSRCRWGLAPEALDCDRGSRAFMGQAPGLPRRLVKLRQNQRGQRLNGLVGIRAAGLDLEPGAVLGGQRRQVENTLAVKFVAVINYPNLRLKLEAPA